MAQKTGNDLRCLAGRGGLTESFDENDNRDDPMLLQSPGTSIAGERNGHNANYTTSQNTGHSRGLSLASAQRVRDL